MDEAFDALGDATRRRILELAAGGERSVGEIVTALSEEMSISQPAVSQHLGVLRAAGLVRVRAEGRHRYYAIDEDGLVPVHAWLVRLAAPTGRFSQPLDALETEVARGRRARSRSAEGGSSTDTHADLSGDSRSA